MASCQQFNGIMGGTMSRDHAYRFWQLGRLVERADMTTRVLDVGAGTLMARPPRPSGHPPADRSPYEDVRWLGVLRALAAHNMYHRSTGMLGERGRRRPTSCWPTRTSPDRCATAPTGWTQLLGELPARPEVESAVAVARPRRPAPPPCRPVRRPRCTDHVDAAPALPRPGARGARRGVLRGASAPQEQPCGSVRHLMPPQVEILHRTTYSFDRSVVRRTPSCSASGPSRRRRRSCAATRCASSPPSTYCTGSRTRSATTSRGCRSSTPIHRARHRCRGGRRARRRATPSTSCWTRPPSTVPSATATELTARPDAVPAHRCSRTTAHRLPRRPRPDDGTDDRGRRRRWDAQSPRQSRHEVRTEPGVLVAGGDPAARRPVRAATARGCWCRCCATWAWRQGSCPGTWSSSAPTGDVTDLHAWAEVFLPGAGWVGHRPHLGAPHRRGPHPARDGTAPTWRGAGGGHDRALPGGAGALQLGPPARGRPRRWPTPSVDPTAV